MSTDWLQSLKPGDKVIVLENEKPVWVVTVHSINSHNQILVDDNLYRFFYLDDGTWEHGNNDIRLTPWTQNLEDKCNRLSLKLQARRQVELTDWSKVSMRKLQAVLKILKGEK